MKRFFLAAMVASSLAGCASYSGLANQPGVTADVVLARLGEPTHRYERNGTEIWEYDRGVYSYYGYHFEFDADHSLVRYVQTRTEKNAATIALHTATEDDVKAIIGWPVRDHVVRGNRIWEWPMVNYVGLPARLVVQFADDGTVSFVGSYALPRGAPRGRS